MSERRGPRHISEIVLENLARTSELEPGQVHHVEVRHDDDCAFWEGRGCDCDPEVESGARVDRKHGGGS